MKFETRAKTTKTKNDFIEKYIDTRSYIKFCISFDISFAILRMSRNVLNCIFLISKKYEILEANQQQFIEMIHK